MGRFSEAYTELSTRVHDTSSDHIDRCKNWLNDAKDQVLIRNAKWDFLQATINLTLTVDQYEYSIADLEADEGYTISLIKSIRIPEEDLELGDVDDEDFDLMYPDPANDDSGRPEVWTIWAGNIVLGPRPNEALDTVIKVYQDIDDFVDDDDAPPWPRWFDNAWIDYAEYIARDFDDDARSLAKLGSFERGIDRLFGAQSRRRNKTYVFSKFKSSGRAYRGPGYPRTFPSPYGGP